MNSMILGRYVPGNSILHRMDPRAKLLGLFLLIVILFWANNVVTNVLLFLLALALILIAKIPFRFFINGLKSMVFIIAFTTLFQLFATTGGKTLFQFYFLTVTDKGLAQAGVIFCRFILIVNSSGIKVMTSRSGVILFVKADLTTFSTSASVISFESLVTGIIP